MPQRLLYMGTAPHFMYTQNSKEPRRNKWGDNHFSRDGGKFGNIYHAGFRLRQASRRDTNMGASGISFLGYEAEA